MRSWLAVPFLLLSACLLEFPAERHPNPAHDVAVAQLDVTFMVNGNASGGWCTAWRSGSEHVLTAGHCCDHPDSFYELRGEHATKLRGAIMPRVDDDADVCELVGVLDGDPLQLADSLPELGEPVWTEGYPGGVFLMQQGLWSGVDRDDDAVISIQTTPGASGAPVLDSRGHVIAMIVGLAHDVHDVAYAVPLHKLRKFVAPR